jgi:hypothetical protein
LGDCHPHEQKTLFFFIEVAFLVDVERVKIKLPSLLADGSDSMLNKETSWVTTSKSSLMGKLYFRYISDSSKMAENKSRYFCQNNFLNLVKV